MRTQLGLIGGFLAITSFFAPSPPSVDKPDPGNLAPPWSVVVGVPVGPGPHTAIVQAAFDQALALQAQFGPGGEVRFPEGNHTYLVGHLDPGDPTHYIGVSVEGFQGRVVGSGAAIAAFDSHTFPFGLREYMLRFDGGSVRISDLTFSGTGKAVGGCLGLFENSSTIENCQFEDFGRSISIGDELPGGTTVVDRGNGAWYTTGEGGYETGVHNIRFNSFVNCPMVVIRANGGVINILENTCETGQALAVAWGNSGTTFQAKRNYIAQTFSAFAFFNQGEFIFGTTHRPTTTIESNRVIIANNLVENTLVSGFQVADDALDPIVMGADPDAVPERAIAATISGNVVRNCGTGVRISGYGGQVSGNLIVNSGSWGIEVGRTAFMGSRETAEVTLSGNFISGSDGADLRFDALSHDCRAHGNSFDTVIDLGQNNLIQMHD